MATPIGNLGDLSPRAVAVLRAVDLVLCEDTRHSRRLLDSHAISTPLEACHEHNERRNADVLVERLREGAAFALISDAGTPLISDPGYALVGAVAAAEIPVRAIPGPCALVAALSIAGLPTDRFVFEGFLPARSEARRERLRALAGETRTLVFYEAPHRLAAAIADMSATFGAGRSAVIAREMTKRFETTYRGTLAELAARSATDTNAARGELVVMVAGEPPGQSSTSEDADRLLRVLLAETDRKAALRIAQTLTGISRNALYQRILEMERDTRRED
ncbi:MAG: 16S rRNA (cytidine(1402)-2'-O)-methyltransferase [Gammaproteobacteria bacterium]